MIYKPVAATDPIRQGDLFQEIPVVGETLQQNAIPFVDKESGKWESRTWDARRSSTEILASIRPTWGIVATQDCDALTSLRISLFEVSPFLEVYRQEPPKGAKDAEKWWLETLTVRTQAFAKCFYLPPDANGKLPEKMAADFNNVFSVPRTFLEQIRATHRLFTLNDEAYQHYRESIARFFQRYAYDVWYPLTKTEMDSYEKDRKRALPRRDYQK
jgi:hypothetical protein